MFLLVLFGTDNFSIKCFDKLYKNKIESGDDSLISDLKVVTPPDQWTGRGNKILTQAPLKQRANEYDIPVYHPPAKSFKGYDLPLNLLNYDLAIVVSFGYFLPKRILDHFKFGGINVHPSLLPKYRGPAPIHNALLNNDKITGITVQNLSTKKFDAGQILNQIQVNVPDNCNYPDLHDLLAIKGSDLLINTLKNWDECQANKIDQNIEMVTHAPKLDRKVAELDFERDDPLKILGKIRALGHKFKLTCTFRNKTVQFQTPKIITTTTTNQLTSYQPGTIVSIDDNKLSIQLNQTDKLLQINGIKVDLKPIIQIKDFINGYDIKIGMDKFEKIGNIYE